jgi:hypothetical protein
MSETFTIIQAETRIPCYSFGDVLTVLRREYGSRVIRWTGAQWEWQGNKNGTVKLG